jgi:hypothetical protein
MGLALGENVFKPYWYVATMGEINRLWDGPGQQRKLRTTKTLYVINSIMWWTSYLVVCLNTNTLLKTTTMIGGPKKCGLASLIC